jgi:hypothetical protein
MAPPPGTYFIDTHVNPPTAPVAPQLLEPSLSPASVPAPVSAAELGRSRRGHRLRQLPQSSILTSDARLCLRYSGEYRDDPRIFLWDYAAR